MSNQVFVARERELSQLDVFLEQAMAGRGMVSFVIGEAGSGKTALVSEFTRRAQARYSNLAVAVGQSDAQTGAGDAHLPFREVLGQLTGDVETKLVQGVITKENANRLKKLLALSGQVLVELGPDLVGVFVPGAGLAMRVGAFAVDKAGWMDRLEDLAGKRSKAAGVATSGINQDHICEQYTNVVCRLSEKQPLLLVLDDLQWADVASIGLLFHLARRISEHRILIVGTYRPEEVAIGRSEQRHPLEKVLNELKRYYGDIWVDLEKAEATEGRRFVDDFLNTEPNHLGEGFRQNLFEHTGGHALFTIELLRAMQERGDLLLDLKEGWIESSILNWESLPKRVEGVIEERLNRLGKELYRILKVGSVEGEDFTAEVIARVETADILGLVQRFSRELDKQHRLVIARGVRRLDPTGQRLSLYRFQHNLFQKYLYNELDEIERAYLHEAVGSALEQLYGDQVDEIVVQLARHFEQAQITEKARDYLRRAGEQAAERYANNEAISYFSRALDLTPEDRPEERFAILLEREQIYSLTGENELIAQDLASLEKLSHILGDDHKRAELALRKASYFDATSDYQAEINAAQEVINLAQKIKDISIQASGNLLWGAALRHLGKYTDALQKFKSAQSLAHTGKLRLVEAKSFARIGMIFSRQGDFTSTAESCEHALNIYREINNFQGEAEVLQILCATFLDFGDYNKAFRYGNEALQLYKRIGFKQGEGNIQGNLGIISAQQGDYSKARIYFQKAVAISKETGERSAQAAALNNLGNLALRQDDYVEANEYLTQVLGICREIGNRRGEGITLNNLANVAKHQSNYGLAREYRMQALQVFRDIGDRHSEGSALGNLGDILLVEGNYDDAQACLKQSLFIAREVGDRQTESDALELFGRYALRCGRYTEAKEYLNQGLEIIRQIGDRQLEGKVLTDLSWLSLCMNENESASEYSRQAIKIGEELGERSSRAHALTFLGHSFEAKNCLPEAVDSYQQSINLRREIGQLHLTIEPLAGLARINLANRNPVEAQANVEEILKYMEGRTLGGLDEPMRVYFTCYRVLKANMDPRAGELLSKAHKILLEMGLKISDPEVRTSYLKNVTTHQEIIQEFTSVG